jgi:hypothetical protein
MYDSFLIREGTVQNVWQGDKIVGFRFGVKVADYRGAFLSLVNGYYIEVDGVEYPLEIQTFEVNGKPPRTYDELKTCVWEHWDCTTLAYIHVKKAGGLQAGTHHFGLQQSLLSHYGYAEDDEKWVCNPPVPGKGEGAGKMSKTCYFDLDLNGEVYSYGQN